uniref:C2H2-type domain-containing protein n=1 Tax=Myripristis murdjan TaxID=586833 RepID=A0A667YCQ5_9TELE
MRLTLSLTPDLPRCRMCAVTFFSKSDMQIHAKSHTEAKPHKCPHCSKSFANSSYLSQHIRIHSGAKPYTCSYYMHDNVTAPLVPFFTIHSLHVVIIHIGTEWSSCFYK